MSIRVHFLSRRNYRAHCFLHPTRVFRRQVRARGLETRTFYRHDHPRLTRCDVLAVVGDYWSTSFLLNHAEDVVEILKDLRKRVGSLIWCDVTDDNGHLFEAAFAHVDLYLKNQALRDRQLYARSYRERSYHGEYYYREFAAEISKLPVRKQVPVQRALEPEEIDKLAISWNVGLGDYRDLWGHGRSLLPYWPFARYARVLRSARETERPVAISCRVSTDYSLPAVTFHRREVHRLVDQLADRPDLRVGCRGWLSRREYMRELANSEICVSPFGFGEICWRDFEALLSGALLVKPDMDHLETWPDYFSDGVTYAAHRWDFRDLPDKLIELAKQPDYCRQLAITAQDRYLAALSREGGERFADHFAALIDCAATRTT